MKEEEKKSCKRILYHRNNESKSHTEEKTLHRARTIKTKMKTVTWEQIQSENKKKKNKNWSETLYQMFALFCEDIQFTKKNIHTFTHWMQQQTVL